MLLTPELSMEIQAALGSDIAMCFDEVPKPDAPLAELARAVERTTRWAERCKASPAAPGQLRFGIVQGGVDEALRAKSAADIEGLGEEVRRRVLAHSGVELRWEIRRIGIAG
jgi:queuine tRNA-ribosyltransferase